MLNKNSLLIPTNFSDIQKVFNRLYDPAWPELANGFSNAITGWTPSVDVKDEDNQYVIHADIPGVETRNIDVTMENGVLTIRGHKESKKKEEKDNYVCIERSEGSFYRSMRLPDVTDSSKINAKIKNGVLEVIVPKATEKASRKISVKEG